LPKNKRKDRLQSKGLGSLNLKEFTMRQLPRKKEKHNSKSKRKQKKKESRLRKQQL
jgi:hypothetical protein